MPGVLLVALEAAAATTELFPSEVTVRSMNWR
jgi:hypothetical protein